MTGRTVAAPSLLLFAACAGAPPTPPPPPEPALHVADGLVRRHFDQVCAESAGRPALQAAEIFDTVGLSEELRAIAAPPFPPGGRSTSVRWRTLDFVSRYSRDGQLGLAGVWETTLDLDEALEVERILRARVRSLPRMLEPEGFRSVVVFSSRPTLDVAEAVVCIPHVQHEDGQRPPGLPAGVAISNMSSRYRPRAGATMDLSTAVVRLELDREGRVTLVEPVEGDPVAITAAREVISQLRFDPALHNGEPVPGEVVYSFRFSAEYLGRVEAAQGRTR